jgi:hypothetical protein
MLRKARPAGMSAIQWICRKPLWPQTMLKRVLGRIGVHLEAFVPVEQLALVKFGEEPHTRSVRAPLVDDACVLLSGGSRAARLAAPGAGAASGRILSLL